MQIFFEVNLQEVEHLLHGSLAPCGNGSVLNRHQAITKTNADLLC